MIPGNAPIMNRIGVKIFVLIIFFIATIALAAAGVRTIITRIGWEEQSSRQSKLRYEGNTEWVLGMRHLPKEYGVSLPDDLFELVKLLRKSEPKVRRRAIKKVIYNSNPSAIMILLAATRDPDAVVREIALSALGDRKSEAEKIVPALIKSINDREIYVRQTAVLALGNFGGLAKTSVPALCKALKVRDSHFRMAVLMTLGRVGVGAGSAVPEITVCLRDKYPGVVYAAVNALESIGTADAKNVVEHFKGVR